MIVRRVSLLSSIAAVLVAVACTNSFEIPIETPIRPKLDVGAFQRVLVAGFIAGGTEDVDGNLETTRLLRSQLRTKSELRVIDTDVLPLMEVANDDKGVPQEVKAEPAKINGASDGKEGTDGKSESKAEARGEAPQPASPEKTPAIKDAKD